MKTVLKLLRNDLRRDAKQPWSFLLFVALPLAMSLLIGAVFHGPDGSGPMPALHIAVLDQDQDLLSRLLRSLPSQGDAASRLQLHFVETREAGFRLVEKGQASALVVLPPELTGRLLAGETNVIEIYENPAQQMLPKIVREGTSLLAVGLAGAAETLGDPLREIRAMVRSNDLPLDASVGAVATDSARRLRGLRTYLFPPIVQFTNVAAADFQPTTPNPAAGRRTP